MLPTQMNPRETGFALEALIESGAKALGLHHKSEQEIKAEFGDSMNGVDHWISRAEMPHILVQTKWRETTTQPEVAQFLACVDRIQARIPGEEVYLLWVSKTEPTKHAKAILSERNVDIVCCSVSIEALARNVLCWIAESYGIDPTPGLLTIPIRRASRSVMGGASSVPPAPVTPIVKLSWDETEEGKRSIKEFQDLLQSMNASVFRRIQNALGQYGVYDIQSIVNAGFPMRPEDWWAGTHSKINFNSLLKALAKICVPTKTKAFQSRNLFFYCKMRHISTELANHVATYMGKRTQMIKAGSDWAKKTPVLLCQPEPMTQEEYKSVVVHSQDYWMYVNRDGTIQKVPSGLENQFFYNYYAN